MLEIATDNLVPALLFVLVLLTGLWLFSNGRPLSTLIVTLHKLLALAGVVLTARAIYWLLPAERLTTPELANLVIAIAGAIAMFASGALLSRPTPSSSWLKSIHRIAPVLTAVAASAALYLLS